MILGGRDDRLGGGGGSALGRGLGGEASGMYEGSDYI